ncbi:MAG TPA: lipoprotein [Rhizobiaceae bacterium]|nr:lipoprotein [Rhizobiaceae bacterium]
MSMRKTLTIAVTVALAAAMLAGCGRRGPLEAPPTSVTQEDGTVIQKPAPEKDKRFVLDSLIE